MISVETFLETHDITAITCSAGISISTQDKKKRKLLNELRGVNIIDCQNDSISVVLSFNKDLYNRVSSKI